MKKENIEKERIHYEQLISGAFLKFKTLDPLDFSILAEDVGKKCNIDFYGDCLYSPNNLGTIIQCDDNGTFFLVNGTSLDNEVNEGVTIKSVLEDVAGPKIVEYFNSLDLEKYYESKAILREKMKANITKNANLLLVSDNYHDYTALIKYGFKKINYFKSMVLADQFFKENPDELDKYHLFIKGSSSLTAETTLERNITDICVNTRRVKTNLHVADYSEDGIDDISIYSCLNDGENSRIFSIQTKSYNETLDRIIDSMIMNKTMNIKVNKSILINNPDYVNPDRNNYPFNLDELKILILSSYGEHALTEELTLSLGLNIDLIDIHDDNNYALGRYAEGHLGEYDIIIGTDLFSKQLLNQADECTEQCKAGMNNLVLLATYDSDGIKTSDDRKRPYNYNGSKIDMKFRFAGPDNECHNITKDSFKVLQNSFVTSQSSKFVSHDGIGEDKTSILYAVLCAALHKYDEQLYKVYCHGLNNLVCPSTAIFTSTYVREIESSKVYDDFDETRAINFDNMMYNINLYLLNKKKGLIESELKQLRIETWDNIIKIWNVRNGKDVCAVTIDKNSSFDSKRLFNIQIPNGKGELGAPMPVGLYTKEHLKKYPVNPFIQPLPNDSQMIALNFLEFVVNDELARVNLEAIAKQYGHNVNFNQGVERTLK